MSNLELYLYGSYAVALVAIVGYQLFVQLRLKNLGDKVAVMRSDTHTQGR